MRTRGERGPGNLTRGEEEKEEDDDAVPGFACSQTRWEYCCIEVSPPTNQPLPRAWEMSPSPAMSLYEGLMFNQMKPAGTCILSCTDVK